MEENAAFETSLKFTKISLLFSGITIDPKKSKTSVKVLLSCLFYFNLLWLHTDVIGEFFWLIEGISLGKSFSELTFIAPCATISILATAKTAPIFYQSQLLATVVNKLREIHPNSEKEGGINVFNKTNSNEHYKNTITSFGTDGNSADNTKLKVENLEEMEKKIEEDSMQFLNRMLLLIYSSCGVVGVIFPLQPVLTMIYEYYAKGETDLKFPFFVKYFFDPYTKSRWPFVYLHQVYSTFIVYFNLLCADSFHYAFCTYIQMHFRILSHRFEHMISWSPEETRKRLVSLVRRHQELIELVDQMEILYSKSTLFHMFSSSVLICLSGFNVTFMDDKLAVISFATFLFMSLSQIFLLCFFGDMIMRSSSEVSEAVYKCRWYDTDTRTKRSLLVILVRAQKPCKLTGANFVNLNLTAFSTIMSRSWSYFALLRTMID